MLSLLSATGCAWFSTDSEIAAIKVVTAPPDPTQCRFIAQAIGTGETIISRDPEDLAEQREEAEANVKRIAVQRGGNVVHIVETRTSNVHGFTDNTQTMLITHVYHCR